MKYLKLYKPIVYFFLYLFLIISFISCGNNDPKDPTVCSCSDFVLYQEASDNVNYNWFPSGWMGAIESLTCDDECIDNPHEGSTCIKITYDPANVPGWGGIYWLNNNGWLGPGVDVYGKYNVCKTCKFKVSFWCRGKNGSENVQFKVGGVSDGNDSMDQPIASSWLTLSDTWTKYKIDITGKNLSNLVGGFCWVIDNTRNSTNDIITIYIDDITYEITD